MEIFLIPAVLFYWILLAILNSVVAQEQKRSQFGWWLIAVFISPPLCILFQIALGKKT